MFIGLNTTYIMKMIEIVLNELTVYDHTTAEHVIDQIRIALKKRNEAQAEEYLDNINLEEVANSCAHIYK